jgi:hypothetical protein
MKHDGIVLAEHFDSLVLQQIRRMERCDVDAALDQLKYKSREKMETVQFMPPYLASFFRTAIGQGCCTAAHALQLQLMLKAEWLIG